ncbi:hypothetical protein RZS08_03660, partial [Arthrospira platensis SPKY1]|nr:hypothetical protein [Arthrospira platensis SPKY1]
WAKAPAGLNASTATAAGLEAAEAVKGSHPVNFQGSSPQVIRTDPADRPFLFSPQCWATLTRALAAKASQPGLMLKADAEAAAGLKGDALRAILDRLATEGVLVREGS